MPPEAKKLLADVGEAAASIEQFARGKTMNDLKADKLLRSGIYYQFVLVGEALAQLRAMDLRIEDRISEAGRIVGFRNQVIHGYAKIDDEITWRIIEQKLPVLRAEVEQLLSE